MRLFKIVILCTFFLKAAAQKNTDSTEFRVFIDSTANTGTIVEKKDTFSSKIMFLHFQLVNHTKEAIMIQRDADLIYHGSVIDYEIQAYSNALKKFINIKTPEDRYEEIMEDNLQPLKPEETRARKGKVGFYTPIKKQCRIRLIFKLSQDNKNVKDAQSNWITI